MAEDTQPSIQLPKSLEIGYHTTLATTRQRISLTAGNHYLLARNGRGKTTLLRTVAQDIQPRSGSFSIEGTRQYIAEDISFDDHLRAQDIFRCLIPKKRLAQAIDFAQEVELDTKRPYGKLSTGNKRKISLIVAEFSSSPEHHTVTLLDEPFTGLDSFSRDKFLTLWKENKESNCRLISCHPDFDSMEMLSAILISDEEISYHNAQDGQTWSELKKKLD